MKEELSTKPDIIVDGRNVAGFGRDGTKEWNWDYVALCAKYYHDKGHKVVVVIPNWLQKDVVEKIKPYTFEIQRVNTNRNKEWDDNMVLALSIMLNGFYVFFDKIFGLSDNFKIHNFSRSRLLYGFFFHFSQENSSF